MATPLNPKATHYEHAVQSALCRGAWADPQPAKTPKGEPISWAELLRKYVKHSKNPEFASIARETREISLLLAASGDGFTASTLDHDCTQYEDAFGPRDECIVHDEHLSDVKARLSTLDQLTGEKGSTPSVLLVRSYAHYASRDSKHALNLLESVDYDGPTSISATASSITAPGSTVHSHGTSSGFSALEAAISRSGTMAGSFGVTELSKRMEGEVGEGKVWSVVERLRGRCLQGMAYERLMDFKAALRSYDAGISLLDRLAVSRTTPQDRLLNELFEKYRELWRWAERAMRGAALVSAKTGSDTGAVRYLRLYSIYSNHWITTFRPVARSATYTLHLRALCLAPPVGATAKQSWREEARRVALDLKGILNVTTKFPRAGEVNHRVLDFVDLCVAVWERGGCDERYASWVIDILWWSTRLSFHSHRVMRHLSSLLFFQNDVVGAQKTFRLYVQLVKKAQQTAAGDVSLQLKRRATDEPPAHPQRISEEIAADEGVAEEALRGTGIDSDSERTFVLHLCWGVAMLAKSNADAKEIEEMANLARVVSESKATASSRLVAKAMRAQGIACLLLARTEPDPNLRPKHQVTALEHLKASAEMDPEAAGTFYHLAIAQAELRDIPAAVLSARTAVEKLPSEIRVWHLLALLLSAQGDWNGSRALLDLALVHADEDSEDIDEGGSGDATPTIDGLPKPDGLMTRDFALNPQSDAKVDVEGLGANGTATPLTLTPKRVSQPPLPNPVLSNSPLLPTTHVLPPSHTLLLPPSDIPLRTVFDRFEASLQLRMTQLALTELVDGAEGANLKWPEVFAFFSERCPSGIGHASQQTGTEGSINGGGTSVANRSVRTGSVRHSVNPPQAPPSEARSSVEGQDVQFTGPRLGRLIPPSPGPGDAPGSYTEDEGTESGEEYYENGHNGTQGGNLPKRILHKSQRQMHSLGKRVTSEARRLDDFVDASMRGVNRRLNRTSSAPDFQSLMASKSYQASSIHSRSRFRVKSLKIKNIAGLDVHDDEEPRPFSPPPPLPPPTSPSSKRPARETRLLSELWLTSAATFRRMGKLDQAKAAIQEAEVLDEENPAVWVQLGLHFSTQERDHLAIESFQKALVIELDHPAALVHLGRQYLKPVAPSTTPSKGNIDLAAGLLTAVTQNHGWDVPDAWYFLAKACALQGRKERERECLIYALQLQESRCIRPLGVAVPRCL